VRLPGDQVIAREITDPHADHDRRRTSLAAAVRRAFTP
jgi:hypothetical protein